MENGNGSSRAYCPSATASRMSFAIAPALLTRSCGGIMLSPANSCAISDASLRNQVGFGFAVDDDFLLGGALRPDRRVLLRQPQSFLLADFKLPATALRRVDTDAAKVLAHALAASARNAVDGLAPLEAHGHLFPNRHEARLYYLPPLVVQSIEHIQLVLRHLVQLLHRRAGVAENGAGDGFDFPFLGRGVSTYSPSMELSGTRDWTPKRWIPTLVRLC